MECKSVLHVLLASYGVINPWKRSFRHAFLGNPNFFIMESDTTIPEDLKIFISKYIHSVEQLEILLLLSASPTTMWPVAHVHQQIQSSEASVATQLELMQEQGFLSAKKMPGLVYEYLPKTAELSKGTVALAALYKEQRIKVIELIFRKPEDKLRQFSDAFKIKRSPP